MKTRESNDNTPVIPTSAGPMAAGIPSTRAPVSSNRTRGTAPRLSLGLGTHAKGSQQFTTCGCATHHPGEPVSTVSGGRICWWKGIVISCGLALQGQVGKCIGLSSIQRNGCCWYVHRSCSDSLSLRLEDLQRRCNRIFIAKFAQHRSDSVPPRRPQGPCRSQRDAQAENRRQQPAQVQRQQHAAPAVAQEPGPAVQLRDHRFLSMSRL